jgi:hypothetical protein
MATTQIRGTTQIIDATVNSAKLNHNAHELYGTDDNNSALNFRITKWLILLPIRTQLPRHGC